VMDDDALLAAVLAFFQWKTSEQYCGSQIA
jgi:hypothetical protein